MRRRRSEDRSSRPVWLGPVEDERGWDHVRVHLQLLRDRRLGDQRSTPKRAVVLAVYLGLAAHAELESGRSRPAAETLGMYAGCNEQTARKALTVLDDAGYIRVTARPGKAPICKLLAPPELPAEHDLRHDTPGLTPDLTPGLTPDLVVHTPGLSHAHPGSQPRTGPGLTPDELEPLNKNQEREGARVDRESSASVEAAEAEAEGFDIDVRGGQLVAEIAGLLDDQALVEALYAPVDTGGRILLGRTLVHLERSGWRTVDLVVEVAAGIRTDTPIGSVVAVLLTRARRLAPAPFGPRHLPDSAGITTTARDAVLDAARQHGKVLATAGLPPDLILDDLESRYHTPGATPSDKFLAALHGAGFVDEHGEPTRLLHETRGAA